MGLLMTTLTPRPLPIPCVSAVLPAPSVAFEQDDVAGGKELAQRLTQTARLRDTRAAQVNDTDGAALRSALSDTRPWA